MGKKKLTGTTLAFNPARIFGVVDFAEKKLVMVSLEETDIEIEMVFRDAKRFFKCEFTVNPTAPSQGQH